MFSRKTIATSAVLAALTVGAAVPAAFAQDASDDPTGTEQTETTRQERHAQQRAELAAALAAELGLDADTVEAALEEVQTALAEERAAERRADLEARLAEAVEAGEVTQEQADALLAADEAGVLRGFGRRGGRGGFGGRGLGGPGGGFAAPSTDAADGPGSSA